MKNSLLTLALILSTFMGLAQSNLIYFESDSHNLSSAAKQKLDVLTAKIKHSKSVNEIGIIGHTDSDASFDYNKALSRERAIAVKEYLSSKGLKNRFHIISKSESELVNKSLTEIEKSKNRRVEIILNLTSENMVYDALKSNYQIYKIPSNKDTLITCKQGTILDFKDDLFKLKNNESELTIKVKEFYKKSDFVASNLSTLTLDGELLESRGMIDLKVFQDDTELKLKDDKTLDIVFKDRKLRDETSLFIGTRTNDEMVWTPSIREESFLVSESGWSVTYIATDTISRSKWWYEDIDGETFKIEYSEENGVERYDTLSVRSERLMKDLVLSTPKLGWINCDRFYRSNQPIMNLIVEYDGDFSPDASLVFTEINSVLPYSYREDNKLVFRNVPVGMKVSVIGLFKGANQDDIYFARTNFTTNAKAKEKLSFKLVPEKELKEKISLL
ncbi:OmpA family protein [Winogradskyella tangerina]|uniref:OmpA family protein n=1 Tax=Winogradskyella tangerina TaxID=2023240 RepID=UPI000DBE854C|nr:OmpA family protein [Winogradskyella tangerina]